MAEVLDADMVDWIVQSVVKNITESCAEEEKNGDFVSGKLLAYYEVLDTIKNRLEIYDIDVAEYGLDMNLEEYFGELQTKLK